MNKLEHMNRVFDLSQGYMLNFHEIMSNSLSAFSGMLSKFERILNEEAREDEFIRDFVNDLRRFRFYVTASVLPFSNFQDQFDQMNLKNLARKCGLMFPDLKESAIRLVEAGIAVVESNEKPGFDFISRQVQAGRNTGLVIKVANNVDLVNRMIQESLSASITVVSPLALKNGAIFEHLIIVGAPHWYPEYLYNSPRARLIDSVAYEWQLWKNSNNHHFSGENSRVSSLYDGCTVTEQKRHFKAADKIIIENVQTNYMALEQSIYRRSGKPEEQSQVPATLVALAGGKYIFLEKHTISNIWVLTFNQEEKVIRLPVQQLDTECYILIRTGTERDVIQNIADQILGEKAVSMRERHVEWKKGLQKLVYKYGYDPVIRALRKNGSSKANHMNLRNWMSLDSIKPRDRQDFTSIIKILKYNDREKDLWREAEILARGHLQAGATIRQQLLNVVNKADLSKLELERTIIFPLPSAEDVSFTAFKVEYIGTNDFYVDEHRTRTLLNLKEVSELC